MLLVVNDARGYIGTVIANPQEHNHMMFEDFLEDIKGYYYQWVGETDGMGDRDDFVKYLEKYGYQEYTEKSLCMIRV